MCMLNIQTLVIRPDGQKTNLELMLQMKSHYKYVGPNL